MHPSLSRSCCFVALALACGNGTGSPMSTDGGSTSGGSLAGGAPSGGATSGGSLAGGNASGGKASGGTASGGTTSGGATSGGRTSGGSPAGGAALGGEASGGTASGGAALGGATSGGATSGGKASGGAVSGGATSGGAASGGSLAGGAASGGKASGGSGGAGSAHYVTDFDLTESPLSEAGAFRHLGLDWTTVNSGNGIAFGTQALGVSRSGPQQYNDSYAYLSGFAPDQQASAIVHLGTIDPGCTHEVEILLRWSDSAHSAQGYECNVAFDGSYAQIVRWNGPVGDYTYLEEHGSVPGGIHDGDTISASIVGTKITLSVNGVVRATADDSTHATGNPGVGFWRGSNGCGTLGDFGFTHFEAK